MTRTFAQPGQAVEWAAGIRRRNQTLGFVPTMGALHIGHLSLVRQSVRDNDATCVSVFVNPLQFERTSDFEKYPRDVAQDAELLDAAGCDVLFTGELADFFPESGGDIAGVERIDPGARALGLEGDYRPGHFAGMATIVQRLFEWIRPTRAYFGEKDFQQTLVVMDLARELGYPEVRVVPTVREASGLACSSRNARLDEQQLMAATAISSALFSARRAWRAGDRDAASLTALIRNQLEATPLEIEYVELRDPDRWAAGPSRGPLETARALVAAYLGDVRLIDNLRLDEPLSEAPEGERSP